MLIRHRPGDTGDNYRFLNFVMSRPGDVGDVVGTQRRLPFIMFLVQGENSQGSGDRTPGP